VPMSQESLLFVVAGEPNEKVRLEAPTHFSRAKAEPVSASAAIKARTKIFFMLFSYTFSLSSWIDLRSPSLDDTITSREEFRNKTLLLLP